MDELRMVFEKPVVKYSAVMQGELEKRIFAQKLQKGRITSLIGFFEDMLKVPDGLVIVNPEGKSYFLQNRLTFKYFLGFFLISAISSSREFVVFLRSLYRVLSLTSLPKVPWPESIF